MFESRREKLTFEQQILNLYEKRATILPAFWMAYHSVSINIGCENMIVSVAQM